MLLSGDGLLLRFNSRLLFVQRVDQDFADAVLLHTFDLSFLVVGHQQGIDLFDFFGAKTKIVHTVLLPIEGDGTQAIDDFHAASIRSQIGLVAQARGAGRNLIEQESVATKRC